MRKQRFMDLSTLTCKECNGKMIIPRNHGDRRARGHIKDMWCPYCKAERKFVELAEYVR